LKLVQERTGNILEVVGIDHDFLNRTNGSVTERKYWQVGLHKLKSFCTTKEIISKLKRLPTK
jgi:hypothetical protein